jgi:predicted transcriptional regulator
MTQGGIEAYMEDLLLSESEYKIMNIIWDNAPIESGKLVKLCESQLSWKKSTTYTMLKKVCEKNIAQNVDSVVSFVVPRQDVQSIESEHVVKRGFGGSLPAFVNAFLGNGKLSKEEADELISLIETHVSENQ